MDNNHNKLNSHNATNTSCQRGFPYNNDTTTTGGGGGESSSVVLETIGRILLTHIQNAVGIPGNNNLFINNGMTNNYDSHTANTEASALVANLLALNSSIVLSQQVMGNLDHATTTGTPRPNPNNKRKFDDQQQQQLPTPSYHSNANYNNNNETFPNIANAFLDALHYQASNTSLANNNHAASSSPRDILPLVLELRGKGKANHNNTSIQSPPMALLKPPGPNKNTTTTTGQGKSTRQERTKTASSTTTSQCAAAADATAATTTTKQQQEQHQKGRPAFFIQQLYEMLMDSETTKIASFLPHGKSFIIHHPEQLVKEILPKYQFKMKNIASFKRQLNMYGFRQISIGPDKGSYYHERFIRKQPQLLKSIQRVVTTKLLASRKSPPSHKRLVSS